MLSFDNHRKHTHRPQGSNFLRVLFEKINLGFLKWSCCVSHVWRKHSLVPSLQRLLPFPESLIDLTDMGHPVGAAHLSSRRPEIQLLPALPSSGFPKIDHGYRVPFPTHDLFQKRVRRGRQKPRRCCCSGSVMCTSLWSSVTTHECLIPTGQ